MIAPSLRDRILAAVGEEPCSTAADVAAEIGAEVMSVSSSLRALWLAGLVKRRAHPRGDRSAVYCYWLTETGCARVAAREEAA